MSILPPCHLRPALPSATILIEQSVLTPSASSSLDAPRAFSVQTLRDVFGQRQVGPALGREGKGGDIPSDEGTGLCPQEGGLERVMGCETLLQLFFQCGRGPAALLWSVVHVSRVGPVHRPPHASAPGTTLRYLTCNEALNPSFCDLLPCCHL